MTDKKCDCAGRPPGLPRCRPCQEADATEKIIACRSAADCSARPSDLLPPREIIEAAATVAMWMDKMGYKNWQLGGVCDRRFAIFAKRVRDASEKWEGQIP